MHIKYQLGPEGRIETYERWLEIFKSNKEYQIAQGHKPNGMTPDQMIQWGMLTKVYEE